MLKVLYISIYSVSNSLFVGSECVLLEVHPNSKREQVVTDAFEFKFIISGECTYIIGEEEVLLKQGDSIFLTEEFRMSL